MRVMVTQLVVSPWSTQADSPAAPRELRAALAVPDDEEVALARVALASQCSGTTRIALGFLPHSVDVLLRALAQFGVASSWDADTGELLVVGGGLGQWTEPQVA
ncbi:MAG TPA: hypothetical protein VN764_15010, partial [Polyangiaceae bacterium]|nr:hypothetical protein [Polyangiaceae bacterium]